MYAIKRELKLNNQERTLMAKHAGFSRASVQLWVVAIQPVRPQRV